MTHDADAETLAAIYGCTESEADQRVYTLAEQIHRSYCIEQGRISHREARPDEHVARAVLRGLASAGWWLDRNTERWGAVGNDSSAS